MVLDWFQGPIALSASRRGLGDPASLCGERHRDDVGRWRGAGGAQDLLEDAVAQLGKSPVFFGEPAVDQWEFQDPFLWRYGIGTSNLGSWNGHWLDG